jgi:TrmH family RNA methyltransferase
MIESSKNELLKEIRRQRRSRDDLAILEGPHLVGEALAAGIALDIVLATPEFAEGAEAGLLTRVPGGYQAVSERALRSVTESETPRGVLATARMPRGGAESIPLAAAGLYVYIDGIQDPGNLGAVARAAEATRVDGLVLGPGSAHPNHPRALRASAGSLLRLPIAINASADSLRRHLEEIDATWMALSPHGETDLFEANLSLPLVLVIGAERGLDPELEAACDRRLRINTAEPSKASWPASGLFLRRRSPRSLSPRAASTMSSKRTSPCRSSW